MGKAAYYKAKTLGNSSGRAPVPPKHIVDNGIRLIKYWLEVGNKGQKRRFEARVEDPLRQWKLSDMDLPSRERWYDYSRARDLMLEATDTAFAPWHIVRSDDKRRPPPSGLNVYTGNDRTNRFAQSLQHGKVVDATCRTHLFRIEQASFVALFSFCEMFLRSRVLLSEWLNDLFGDEPGDVTARVARM